VTTDLLRRYGRSLRGTRLHDHTPCGHWQTHTVVAGLRLDGLTAPAVFDRPIDNPTCRAYVEQVLVPALRRGDVVVLDNLAVHKQPKIRTAIEAPKRAPAISAAVQPGLQSDRTSLRETQSVSARRTTTQHRSGLRAHGHGHSSVHTHGMRELCAALRLSHRYIVMKNALAQAIESSSLKSRVVPTDAVVASGHSRHVRRD
jgi:hypothetical protein